MKKIIAALLALLLILSTAGCMMMNSQREIAAMVGVELPKGKELSSSDTHGGFHGDGLEVTVLEFEENVFPDGIEGLAGWHALPISDPVRTLLYGTGTGDDQDGPYLHDGDGNPLIPDIGTGYYFFRDRHSEQTDPYDESLIFDRYSFNLTVAVYDSQTNRLYYLAFDT